MTVAVVDRPINGVPLPRYPSMARPHNGCMPPTVRRRRRHHKLHVEAHGQNQHWYRLMLDHWSGVPLSSKARDVLRILVVCSSPSLGRDVLMSRPQLAARTSASPEVCRHDSSHLRWAEGVDAIDRAIGELVNGGWIEIEDRPLQAGDGSMPGAAQINCYRILVPGHMQDAWETVKANARAKGGRTSKPPAKPAPAPATATKSGRRKPDWVTNNEQTLAAQQALMAANQRRNAEQPPPVSDPEAVRQELQAARKNLKSGSEQRAGP